MKNVAIGQLDSGQRPVSSKPGSTRVSGTVTIEEAQNSLKELVRGLAPGEEVVITENQKPIARLVSEQKKPVVRQRPAPGLGKGMISILSDDDEHLKDFAEYMP